MTPEELAAQDAFMAAIKERLRGRAALMLQANQDVIKILAQARAQLTERLAAQPSDFERWQLPQLLAQIEAVLDGALAAGAGRVDGAIRDAWQQGEDFIDKPLAAGGLNIEAQMPLLDVTLLTKLRSFTTSRIKDISREALGKVNSSLSLVTIGAKTPFQAIKDIQVTLGDEATRRATTIVRTEVGRAFALGSFQRMEQAAVLVPALMKQWRRSGKLHSRWNHDLADGQVVEVKKPFVLASDKGPVKMMHPHDPTAPIEEVINCGCIAIPWMKSWKVMTPGAKPFTELEIQGDGRKAQIDQAAKRAGARRTPLPYFQNAQIPVDKLRSYALNTDHPVGGNKARVFASALGFTPDNAHLLEAAIQGGLPKANAARAGTNQWGERYTVDVPVTGPAGSAIVRTGWLLETGSASPKMTTAYVKPKAR